ncbi:glutathione S-transferase family protein [Pseudoxanthomonas daejeonensis]|uniref:glutathione S-transferase family protein n=1 Tax=Pseudoxanthomonas daejeonensis TaxID=266062 RepID=UPI001F541BAD|nr:glutathione S-transferase family protein [Pseudoxanthomonas daejeonensis]UNK57081.1 glutathione S-transferase family protein [Pseudoxanthomonas daejeonensis]
MSVVLYGSPSTASLVVHWLLIELGIEHELHQLDFDRREQKSPEYLAINPAGRVPTLLVDGQVLTESAAIAMQLADLYPQAGLAPAPGTAARGAYYRWVCFCVYTLMPAYRGWFYADEPAGEANAALVRERARIQLEAAWQQVADHLEQGGPYMLGAQPSAVDFVLTMLMRWSRNMPRPTDDWPVLRDFARRMKDRPSFAEVYRREGISDWT